METAVWLVPATVAVAGLRDPRWGLVVLIAALPLFGSPPGGPYLAALDVAVLAAVCLAWRAGAAERSPLDGPSLAFVFVSLCSLVPLSYLPPTFDPLVLLRMAGVFPELEPWTTAHGWRAAANLVIGFALFWAVRRAFRGRSVQPLWWGLLGGLALAVLAALAAHVELLDLDGYRAKGGARWESRLHSFFFHSGWFAEYLIVAGPICVALLLRKGRRGLLAASFLAAVLLPTVFLTEQRGAWFTLVGQVILATLLWARSGARSTHGWRPILIGLGAAILTLGLAVSLRGELFASAIDRARIAFLARGRPYVWEIAGELTAERPLLGWGLGHFSPAFHQKTSEPAPGQFDWLTAHNQYLMVSVERGLLGLAAFLCWILVLLVCLGGRLRGPPGRCWVGNAGLAVSLCGFLAYGLVQYVFFLRVMEWLIWVIAGVVALEAGDRPLTAFQKVARGMTAAALVLLPWRALATQPLGDELEHRSYGFHRAETSEGQRFEWTGAYAVWRVPWQEEPLELLAANGHPRTDRHPVELTVTVDGNPVIHQPVPGEWTRLAVDLGPENGPWVVIEIRADPTFRPFSDDAFRAAPEPSVDIRRLGLAVRRPRSDVDVDPAPAPSSSAGAVLAPDQAPSRRW